MLEPFIIHKLAFQVQGEIAITSDTIPCQQRMIF